MIYNKKGDLLKMALAGHFDYIIHGCNCFNTMGAGIAAQIAVVFPGAARADRRTLPGDLSKFGSWTFSIEENRQGKRFQVVNAYTQYQPGPDFELFALEMFLYKFRHRELLGRKVERIKIGVPWIGCGIGGGQKKDVKKVLYQFAASTPTIDLTIVEYKP